MDIRGLASQKNCYLYCDSRMCKKQLEGYYDDVYRTTVFRFNPRGKVGDPGLLFVGMCYDSGTRNHATAQRYSRSFRGCVVIPAKFQRLPFYFGVLIVTT